jgi:hypothetical protein
MDIPSLAAWTPSVHEIRVLELGISIGVNVLLGALMALHWQYRAKCSQTHSSKPTEENAWGWWKCFDVGLGLCVCFRLLYLCLPQLWQCVGANLQSVADWVSHSAAPFIRALLGGVTHAHAPIQDILVARAPYILVSGLLSWAVKEPQSMCMLERVCTLQAECNDMIVWASWWVGWLLRWTFTLYCITAMFESCCGFHSWLKHFCTDFCNLWIVRFFRGNATSAIFPPSGSGLLIANETNVKKCALIGTPISAVIHPYDGMKSYGGLMKYYKTNLVVDAKQPPHQDQDINTAIKKALEDQNIADDNQNKAKILLLEEQLWRLNLRVPYSRGAPKKKK